VMSLSFRERITTPWKSLLIQRGEQWELNPIDNLESINAPIDVIIP